MSCSIEKKRKMSFESWLDYIKNANKTSIISGKVRKIHYKFQDGKEMAEEYSLETGCVLRRAWKKPKSLTSKESEWEIELGEPVIYKRLNSNNDDDDDGNDGIFTGGSFYVRESNTAPQLTKRITKKNIEWRIRNLPYPIDVYEVTADQNKNCIVVRTKNKKYYKVINIPELQRCETVPEQSNITVHHQYNTLIITYKKPEILNKMEIEILKILKDVDTEADMDDFLNELLKTTK